MILKRIVYQRSREGFLREHRVFRNLALSWDHAPGRDDNPHMAPLFSDLVAAVRVIHAILFEVGLLVMLLPVIAWYDVGLV